MATLRSIILDNDTRAGRVFDLFIQFLIIISLISFSLETIKGESKEYYQVLDIMETVTVIIFSVEYLLRLILEEKKLKFFFSFFGLVE